MADSFVTYTGDGSTTIFSIPFGYLDPAHVTAKVDGITTAITFPSAAQAEFAVAPANATAVKILRTTPRDDQEVVWSNGANLTEGDLNTSDLQLLYVAQETADTASDSLLKDDLGVFDATSIRIQNVATPTASGDAANKAYVDASTVDIVADAQAAQVAAESAKTDAEAALVATQAVYDNFDDRYLGTKSSAPTLDNDGAALIDGALYYNTTDNKMYVYDLGTTTWLAVETNISDGSITAAKLATDSVTTVKITDGAVTKAKIEDVASMKVLGNTTGSTAAPAEVSVLDEDTMSSDSAAALATQQSIKAYVDAEVAGAGGGFDSGQSASNVVGSRAVNTVYTNSTGAPIFVAVNIITNNNKIELEVDGIVFAAGGENSTVSGSVFQQLSAIVPAGSTYELTGSAAIDSWAELR